MRRMARPLPRRRPPWLAACAMAGAGSLAIVTTAAAAPPTIDRQSGSGIFWNAGSPNPTYVITATGGETSLSYTTSESATPVEVPANGVVALPSAPQGARSLTAFPTGAPDESFRVNFTVDTTPPSVSIALVGTANAAGWYRAPLTIQPTCTDNLLPVTGCDPFQWTTDGAANTAPVSVTDAAGNVGTGSVSPPFKLRQHTAPTPRSRLAGACPAAPLRNHRRQRAPVPLDPWCRPDLRPRSLRVGVAHRRRHRRGCVAGDCQGRRHWSR